MPDDLDHLLRAAMKTLDDQVPPGYFEGLPNQTLARLEVDMQQGTTGTTDRDISANLPPPVATKDDSGLHDIRNLAQSTKQRLSSKRSTTNPPFSEQDVLASSSASWKNLALPQPAKMVSLPALDELPSKAEIRALDKAAQKAAKAAPKAEATAAEVVAAAAPVTEMRQPFSGIAQRHASKSKTPMIALVGMGLAAAAGAAIFVATRGSDKAASEQRVASSAPGADMARKPDVAKAEAVAAVGAGSAAIAAPDLPATAPAAGDDKLDTGAAGAPAAQETKTGKLRGAGAAHGRVEKDGERAKDATVETTKPADKPADKNKGKGAGGAKGEGGDPSFDDLLKEAGVNEKKDQKPKLEKKALTSDDFKHGMASVAAKAQGCFKGTQGTAAVKLTIAPSGQVSKVSVSGQFAGKPEADCVVAAVKGATFPAWDGSPQSFGWSYLLSD
jgi:hypothetical protein